MRYRENIKNFVSPKTLCLFSTDTEGLMPKKMEEIAYTASDNVYGKEDTGPYECLRFVLVCIMFVHLSRKVRFCDHSASIVILLTF